MTDLDQFRPYTTYYCGACEKYSTDWEDPKIWDMSADGGGKYIQANCPKCHSSRLLVVLVTPELVTERGVG